MVRQSPAPRGRPPRTFRSSASVAGLLRLHLIIGGVDTATWTMTQEEARACAETILAAIGWKPVGGIDASGTRPDDGSPQTPSR